MKKIISAPIVLFFCLSIKAQKNDYIESSVDKIESKCIAWRRDFHEHPELSNREFRTSKIVAEHLKSLGLEVRENVAHTGVIGILRGAKPGPVIGLRADMDALPVVERTPLPFASKVKSTYNGQEVGVMHACGHDTHVAMLMSTAEILAGMKSQLSGTVKFIFQPAEEGPPQGEEGGAELMVKEGALDNPKVDVMFGIHIKSSVPVGQVTFRKEGFMAASDWFVIKIHGTQTHGAYPWLGNDPVVIGTQIVSALQTIVSRQSDLTKDPVVISTTIFNAGVRSNIIPEEVTLGGTIRTLDSGMQHDVWRRIKRTAKSIAEAFGATADVEITTKTLITYNNPKLSDQMMPSLLKATNGNVVVSPVEMGSEDFSYFSEKVPAIFFYVGGLPPGKDPKTAPPHHTPDFYIDESGMKTGIRSFLYLVTDYMNSAAKSTTKKNNQKSF
ncbi:MAG TPA: amidohydrolase [Flavisolibacter sp.]|nr:amidohydrolase [Flavisolibacter sp.]